MHAEQYNYAIFPPEDDVDAFNSFASHLKVGDIAPDPEFTALNDKEPARLSDFTSRGMTVVEFGSLT